MRPAGPFRFRVRQGLNIPLSGRPKQEVTPGPEISQVALCGPDYVGLKPRVLVNEGDTVHSGQPLFQDKRDPKVNYGSPGSGTVVAVHRGARRALESVVVRLEGPAAEKPVFNPLSESEVLGLGPERTARRLQRSGLWTAFRTRPFSRVPVSSTRPRSIFVTAIDTRPLAPDPEPLIRERAVAFTAGLQVLTHLTTGTVYLCTRPGWSIPLPEMGRLQRAEFAGPHPAGLPGTHIHLLDPVDVHPAVWHVGYQDVIAMGVLFREGVVDHRRVVSLAGPCVSEPRLLRTRAGASISELTAGRIRGEASCRVLSGSVLEGRTASGGLAFLGRYHQQVSVIREGGDRHLLGWMGIFPWRYSAARTFLKQAGQARRHALTTAQNGRFSGMLPTRAFEKILPLDILPSPLFRALLVRDTDQAQALGCLELDEEDLALCSFVCPAKNDYGAALRINLEQIEREG